ncbi:hypothetical protein EBESD8_56900 [Rhodococcus aetherivorans]|nr:hypothetical protein EBESD8_56900 [Rhodococcus aetherivorans]
MPRKHAPQAVVIHSIRRGLGERSSSVDALTSVVAPVPARLNTPAGGRPAESLIRPRRTRPGRPNRLAGTAARTPEAGQRRRNQKGVDGVWARNLSVPAVRLIGDQPVKNIYREPHDQPGSQDKQNLVEEDHITMLRRSGYDTAPGATVAAVERTQSRTPPHALLLRTPILLARLHSTGMNPTAFAVRAATTTTLRSGADRSRCAHRAYPQSACRSSGPHEHRHQGLSDHRIDAAASGLRPRVGTLGSARRGN